MSYSPNNVQMFAAVYAGTLAGMGASDRVTSNSDAASYAGLAIIAGAFARAFDTLWGSRSTTLLDIEEAQSLSAAAWQNRAPQVASISAYTVLATSLIAMMTAGAAFFASQGITPPAIPTSGGGGSFLMTFAGHGFNAADTDVRYFSGGGEMVVDVISFPILPNFTPLSLTAVLAGSIGSASILLELTVNGGTIASFTITNSEVIQFVGVDPIVSYEPQSRLGLKATYVGVVEELTHYITATVQASIPS